SNRNPAMIALRSRLSILVATIVIPVMMNTANAMPYRDINPYRETIFNGPKCCNLPPPCGFFGGCPVNGVWELCCE
ncbi:hypothetical protein BG000_011746, partial [Podila horticola]